METVERPPEPGLERVPVQTSERNLSGRAVALTLATAIKSPRRLPLLNLNFYLTRKFPTIVGQIDKLSFIHFCRWFIVHELPYLGPPQKQERLHYRYLFFLSNYNGYWMQYIDAFANILGYRLNSIWGHCYGYPGAYPPGPLKRVIHEYEYELDHFYSAYPDASVTMVRKALTLKGEFDAFAAQVADVEDAKEFDRRYREFLAGSQIAL